MFFSWGDILPDTLQWSIHNFCDKLDLYIVWGNENLTIFYSIVSNINKN